jgi:hypothetical protein
MTRIVEFLEARYGELEHAAKSAGGIGWVADLSDVYTADDEGRRVISDATWAVANHVALHDPEKTLRDLAAKRALTADHADCGSGGGYCDDGGHGWDHLPEGGCSTLAHLAAPYDQHPDFDPAWRL